MSDPILLYGANGYTGRLIANEMRARGLRPVLGGRNAAALATVAGALGLEHRVAALTAAADLDAALAGMKVVLNAAGPFSHTAQPMLDACLRAGAHYLDVAGEVLVIEAIAARDAAARQRGIMAMPGTGFDVVPSDCLGAHVARRLPGAARLAFGFTGLELTTRGSAKTFAEHAAVGVNVRRDGAITPVPAGRLRREFDYGAGSRESLNVSWGDVATAYYTTGIANIEVYFEATPTMRAMLMASRYGSWFLRTPPWQAWIHAHADLLPAGPSDAERAWRQMVIVAEASDGRGRVARARLRTPEAYTFTGHSAAAIAARVLRGDCEIGFQTPARVYGADCVLDFAGVEREDL